MMLPIELPTELIIHILSYLPLTSIAALQRVDRQWNTFMHQNQSTVYRNAAWMEGWSPSPQTLLEELDHPDERMRRRSYYSKRAMRGVNNWKELCHRRRMIQRSWAGHAPSAILSSPRIISTPLPPNVRQRTPYRRVHRIKVDEKVGIIMTTSAVGGLVVKDLETDQILWELPTWYVRSYAHLEYGEGYVIFDRDDGNKEVWRRTEDVTDPSTLTGSFPDQRQVQMNARVENDPSSCSRAQFTPYALFQMPEHTRAYRFVYPTLLVASLERAFLWDIRTGELIQTLDAIQIVLPFGGERRAQDEPSGSTTDDNSTETSYHSDSGSEQAHTTQEPSPEVADQPEMEFDSDTEENDSEEDSMEALPQFLGLIRYVELSERHVIIVGRYLLRIFSRETGKAVIDVPSTLARYGAAKWEVRSQDWVDKEDRKGKGKYTIDTYDQARREGREVVRVPLEFTFEQYKLESKLVIDQFVAAHISADGKHIAAMLSGSRVIVIPNFENLCNTNLGSDPMFPQHPHSPARGSATPTPSTSALMTRLSNRPSSSLREYREARKRFKQERDRAVFERTLDIRLGSPQVSTSVYLAFENGRIGVVTTNAVYIVSADLSSPFPAVSALPSSGKGPGTVPCVRVARLPFFSHPSWLSAVSCLMMSDTGLYLNWNPTSPPPPPPSSEDEDDEYDSNGDENDLRRSPSSPQMTMRDGLPSHWTESDLEMEARRRAYEARREQRDMWAEWANDYEDALETYERSNEEDLYHVLPNGDMLITQDQNIVWTSEVSTVYSVDFAVGGEAAQAAV